MPHRSQSEPCREVVYEVGGPVPPLGAMDGDVLVIDGNTVKLVRDLGHAILPVLEAYPDRLTLLSCVGRPPASPHRLSEWLRGTHPPSTCVLHLVK